MVRARQMMCDDNTISRNCCCTREFSWVRQLFNADIDHSKTGTPKILEIFEKSSQNRVGIYGEEKESRVILQMPPYKLVRTCTLYAHVWNEEWEKILISRGILAKGAAGSS